MSRRAVTFGVPVRSVGSGLDSCPAGNERMMTDNTPPSSGLFGVYLQADDLDRSLSFYRDVLALDVVWNDGALAVLHGHRAASVALLVPLNGRPPSRRSALRPDLGQVSPGAAGRPGRYPVQNAACAPVRATSGLLRLAGVRAGR